MARGLMLPAAVAALLAFAPAAPAQAPDDCGVPSRAGCRGAEKVAERGAAECRRAMYAGQADPDSCPALPIGRRVSRAAIAEYEKSWLHKTIAFQHHLGNDVAFRDAPWLGTHNSYNDPNEQPTLSHTDSNQQLNMLDQLRIDQRSLEIDVHWLPSPRAGGRPAAVLCHGQGQYAGCTTERLLSERLPEITAWLDKHPKEVLLLYVQDEIYEAPGYENVIETLTSQLGKKLFKPEGGGCQTLPLDLTRLKVLKAGAQVVIVSSCGDGPSLAPVAYSWPSSVRFESRPYGFGSPQSCDNDGKPVPYASHLVRFYEDSTWLSVAAQNTGVTRADDGLTPETLKKMLACGVDLIGFDQILPDDGRLAAAAWSWDALEPKRGACAVIGPEGRWASDSCQPRLPVACRADNGTWSVLPGYDKPQMKAKLPNWYEAKKSRARKKAKARSSVKDKSTWARSKRDAKSGKKFKKDPFGWVGGQCAKAGLSFAAPRTAFENSALQAAAGGKTVLIGLRRKSDRFWPTDKR